MTTKTLYHATYQKNLPSIEKDGLLLQVGERSALMNESPGIFLFPNYEDCEHALMNWLGEEFEDFDEEEPVITLEVTLPADFALEEIVEWERVARASIPPDYIRFFKFEG